MHEKNYRCCVATADLNLFAVFEALERERSVTRAAAALGLSQPAVSHALNRLRDQLKDQLFVRGASGMEPTPRARELAGPIRDAVGALQATLAVDRFDPATARDRFTIAMDNVATIVFAAPLAAEIARTAPHVHLVVKPSGTLDVDLLLGRGAIDLAVGPATSLEADDRRHLRDDRYVVVMRRDHPAASSPLTCEAFAATSHLKISSIGDDAGFIEAELGKRGLARVIRLEVPYIATGAALSHSDLLTIVVRGVAVELCRQWALVWRDLPFEAPATTIGMRWPAIYERRLSHRWLREKIKSLE